MKTFKITNITNNVNKRDPKYNSVVNIEYIDNRTKKTILLKAGEDVFLVTESLPLSVHRLRIKKLIEISETNTVEMNKTTNKPKPPKKKVDTKKTVRSESGSSDMPKKVISKKSGVKK